MYSVLEKKSQPMIVSNHQRLMLNLFGKIFEYFKILLSILECFFFSLLRSIKLMVAYMMAVVLEKDEI